MERLTPTQKKVLDGLKNGYNLKKVVSIYKTKPDRFYLSAGKTNEPISSVTANKLIDMKAVVEIKTIKSKIDTTTYYIATSK